MPVSEQVQLQFGGGMNASVPPHLLADDQVQTATNVDFSLERGAASCRRGSEVLHTVTTSSAQVRQIYRNYNTPSSLATAPVYVNANTNVYRGVSGTYTAIQTGGAGNIVGFSSYRQHAFIGVTAGTNSIKDDGTTVTQWIKQSPSAAPTVTINTLTALTVASTYTAAEGTLSSTNTGTTNAVTYRLQLDAVVVNTNLDSNGGGAIGDYGLDCLSIKVDKPEEVTRISRDYSIADSSFTNYYHTEYDIELAEPSDALPDVDVLIDSELSIGTATTTNVDSETRAEMTSNARREIRSPQTRISAAANVFNLWAVPRTRFELINKSGAPVDWTNIQKVRVIVEANKQVVVELANWEVRGSTVYPLNDPDLGYAYWETWATLDSNNAVISESAPGPATTRQKMQNANVTLVSTASATGTNPAHDLTHRIFYRQGGYLEDAYAVATVAMATTTFTDSMTDIQALSVNNRMLRNIHSRSSFYNNIVAISDPFYDRIFVGQTNKLGWSLPGKPDTFPVTSIAAVGALGDEITGLVSWAPTMIIINRDSVYEMQGTEFEAPNANYTIQRTGSRHGSKAKKAIIKTPYGIPLIDYDGISMYQPGQGIDIPLDWAMEKIADTFRGQYTDDPAALKGNRIPALNNGFIDAISAAYADGKLYVAMACGDAQTTNNYVFVLDFRTKQVWVHKYLFDIACLFWDFVDNTLMAGTYDGKIMRLETGTQDQSTNGTSTNISWTFKTREWTAPVDTVAENIFIEHKGGTTTALALYDGTTTTTLGTLTGTAKDWFRPNLGGTFAQNVSFKFNGTQGSGQQNAIYGVNFDALLEPKRVNFWKTEYETEGHDPEKLWDVHYADLQVISGNVLGTVFVDGSAVMTHTVTGPTSGRSISVKSFPPEIYGKVAYVQYSASGTGTPLFKHWKTSFDARPEPPRVNNYRTDIQSLEENICDAIDVDINPNGTVTGQAVVDNTSTLTFTITGTNRQSYTFALPNEVYGRTIYGTYTGAAFKHYNTWFHLRPEPDRWSNFVTDRQPGEETIFDAVDVDVNPLGGTVLGTVMVDTSSVAIGTFTGTVRTSVTLALPNETYGRNSYVIYNAQGTGKFKHYRTWFHQRPEPDRWSNFVTDRESGNEQLIDRFECDVNPLGNVILSTVMVDNTAVGTYIITGGSRTSVPFSLPAATYGRTRWVIHNGYTTGQGTATALFKHYRTWFEGTDEPDRVHLYQTEYLAYPSNQSYRTWIPELNPLGTCTGVLYSNDVAIMTATFTGTERTCFNVGLDVDTVANLREGDRIHAIYQHIDASGRIKHYSTKFEMEPQVFTKKTWSITYKKIGGASQLDMGRFWSYEISVPSGTATVTSVWDIDGQAFLVNTFTAQDYHWRDRVPFPPGARGYVFQQRLLSDVPIQVYKVSLDAQRIGIKGFSRITMEGTPK